eukprot:366341-Chlamydomonas_euryale.AAC.17
MAPSHAVTGNQAGCGAERVKYLRDMRFDGRGRRRRLRDTTGRSLLCRKVGRGFKKRMNEAPYPQAGQAGQTICQLFQPHGHLSLIRTQAAVRDGSYSLVHFQHWHGHGMDPSL